MHLVIMVIQRIRMEQLLTNQFHALFVAVDRMRLNALVADSLRNHER